MDRQLYKEIIEEIAASVYNILNESSKEKKQLGDVKTKWHPKKDIFKSTSASEIANYLLDNSSDEAQAMRRLNFYMNRAGKNLKNKTALNAAKKILEKHKKNDD